MGDSDEEEMEIDDVDEQDAELEDSMTLDEVQNGIRKGSLVRRISNYEDSSRKKVRIEPNDLGI